MQALVIIGGLVVAVLIGLGLYYFIMNVRLGPQKTPDNSQEKN